LTSWETCSLPRTTPHTVSHAASAHG